MSEFNKALDVNKNSSLAHYRIAEVFFLQHNYQAAANAYRESLNGDGEPRWTEVWSHVQLGKIFDVTGQRERATNEYRQALQTNDNTQGAMDEARKYLQKAFEQTKGLDETENGAPINRTLGAIDLLVSPAQQRRAHRESRADRSQQHQIALLQLAFLARCLHGQRNRRGCRVAEAIDVDDHAFRIHAHAISRRRNDSFVGLMRNKAPLYRCPSTRCVTEFSRRAPPFSSPHI